MMRIFMFVALVLALVPASGFTVLTVFLIYEGLWIAGLLMAVPALFGLIVVAQTVAQMFRCKPIEIVLEDDEELAK